MKKLHIGLIISALLGSVTGATAAITIKSSTPIEPTIQIVEKIKIVEKQSYGIELYQYQDLDFPAFTYDQEWMEDYSEKFAYKFDKALFLCDKKYSYILEKTGDTSTDYGSEVIAEYNKLSKLCVDETLKNEEPVDQDDRTGGRDMSQNSNDFRPEK